jgi:phenylpropionate dioxygenase-like ring-hydroxylating dioxygenase large terminal subunit
MDHAEHVRLIRMLMTQLDEDTNVDAGGWRRVPVTDYTEPTRAQAEWDNFFQHGPLVMGLSADLPEAGSFFTNDDLGRPILCTRDADGAFHAFLNVCRHRGTILESEARGRKRVFTCPFHAWSYGSDGALRSVPRQEHFGRVDRDCNSLVELPSAERHGLLWLSLDRASLFDIDAELGDLGPELAAWELARATATWRTRYDHAMNWKLAIDTFGETYHFDALHRDTLASFLHGNCQAYDTYGRHHRMLLTSRRIDDLRQRPEEDWHLLRATIPVYYLFPNVQLILGAGGPTLVRVYPEGADPHRSFSRIDFYTHPHASEFSDEGAQAQTEEAILARAQGFAEVIRDEDYVAAASSHRGATSGAITHFTFGRNEPALHHYHQTYRAALDLPELPLEDAPV